MDNAGGNNPLSECALGEVLALRAWVLVFVDICYTLIMEVEKGLEGNMLADFSAVPNGRSQRTAPRGEKACHATTR
ncbi:hypothetical protein F4677DRAFT_406235 [Hypoxylon crocopeplum]|nr:hypothetical protein F4677DRAFT_406235 [Hypoxylon crocopeplum]